MRVLVALFLVGHGLVHAVYVGQARRRSPSPGPPCCSGTGPSTAEPAFQERNLSGRALGGAEGVDPEAAAATVTELPETCAGLERAAFVPLLPAGFSPVEAREADGACRLVVTSGGDAR